MEEEKKEFQYTKRPLWQWFLLYAVVAIVLYGLLYYFVLSKNKGGYGGSNSQNPYQSQSQSSSSPSSPSSPASSAVNQKFTVVGTEFAFTPSTISVKTGQPVQVTFKNNGKFPHNLTFTDLNVGTKTISPGEEDTITFTPNKTGDFTFICTVPTHADRGMKGTLTVQ